MTATKLDICMWYDKGVAQGATHMIVVCDTFDYDNYPVYVMPGEDAREKAAKFNGPNMQKVDEVYDLRLSRTDQLAENRAFHY